MGTRFIAGRFARTGTGLSSWGTRTLWCSCSALGAWMLSRMALRYARGGDMDDHELTLLMLGWGIGLVFGIVVFSVSTLVRVWRNRHGTMPGTRR